MSDANDSDHATRGRWLRYVAVGMVLVALAGALAVAKHRADERRTNSRMAAACAPVSNPVAALDPPVDPATDSAPELISWVETGGMVIVDPQTPLTVQTDGSAQAANGTKRVHLTDEARTRIEDCLVATDFASVPTPLLDSSRTSDGKFCTVTDLRTTMLRANIEGSRHQVEAYGLSFVGQRGDAGFASTCLDFPEGLLLLTRLLIGIADAIGR